MIKRLTRLILHRHPEYRNRETRIGMAMMLCAVGLVLLLRAVGNTQKNAAPIYPLTWSSYYGVCLKQNAKHTEETHQFLSRSGKVILLPCYTFWNKQLVYWSEDDKALCLVPLSGIPRWLSLGDRIPSRIGTHIVSVTNISPSHEGIFFNVGQVGVYYLDVETNAIEPIADAMEVRGTDASATYAFVDAAGKFHRRSPAGDAELGGVRMPVTSGNADWDYCAKSDTFCLVDGRAVTVIRSGVRKNWTLPVSNTASNVSVDSGQGRLWFHIRRHFNNGSYLINTDWDGRRDNRVITSADPFRRPIGLADQETRDLIRKLPILK